MKVFIDIGSHYGQSLEVAMDPKYGFEEILCFEPSQSAFKKLTRIRDHRVKFYNFGLGSDNWEAELFGSGELGGSIFENKIQKSEEFRNNSEKVLIKSASEILGSLLVSSNEIYIKLNCEGSEILILEDLIVSDLLNEKIKLYIDFDIRKVKGMEHLALRMESILASRRVSFVTPSRYGVGAAQGVRDWLNEFCSFRKVSFREWLNYHLKLYRDLRTWLYRLISTLIPFRVRVYIFSILRKYDLISWIRH